MAMSLRTAVWIGLVAWFGAACGTSGSGSGGSGGGPGSGGGGTAGSGGGEPGAPGLEGFFSGGFAGYECPPASEPSGNCNEADCGVGCVANTTCDPAAPVCPPGYECSEASDPAFCLPAKICASSAECEGEYCATGQISQGICVPVDPTPVPCDANGTCAWPFWCGDGQCELFCNQDECPTGYTCLENRCQPG
jgi:hypothetical protein